MKANKKKAGSVEVKKLSSGKLTFKLSGVAIHYFFSIIGIRYQRTACRTSKDLMNRCVIECVDEVYLKVKSWTDLEIKFTLTPAQASAIAFVLIPYHTPTMIDLKAQLLKAL